MDESDPLQNYHTIRRELTEYGRELDRRPEIVAITKAELPEAQQIHAQFESELGRPVLLVSAVTGQNLNQLVRQIAQQLETCAKLRRLDGASRGTRER